MEVIVTDREGIEACVRVRSPYIVISIRDPDKPKARVVKQSGLRDVLYLAFDDAEPSEKLALPKDIVLMTEDQAKQVWEFVQKWERQIGTVVVHCEMGMSRSPAVAAALTKIYGGDHQQFFNQYQPNLFVFWLMLQHQENSQTTS